MGGVCPSCPCWPSHDYTEIPTTNPGVEVPTHKKKKDYHVAFQSETAMMPEKCPQAYPSSNSDLPRPQEKIPSSNPSKLTDGLINNFQNHQEEAKSPILEEHSPMQTLPEPRETLDCNEQLFEEDPLSSDHLTLEVPPELSEESSEMMHPIPADTNVQQQKSMIVIEQPKTEAEPMKDSTITQTELLTETNQKNEMPRAVAPARLRDDQALCSKCGKVKNQGDFSKNQWKKKTQKQPMKCQDCVNRG